jgi:hypothetical protein
MMKATKAQIRQRGVMPGRDLPAKLLDRWPGDAVSELTGPAEDETGKVWPAGTRYTPLGGGCDQRGPRCNGTYQTVTVQGVPSDECRATFRFGGLD